MNRSNKRRLATLETVSRTLSRLEFPKLERPDVPYGASPTIDLLDWGTRLYCFSILGHFCELLNSFIILSKRSQVPAAFVIARSIYEIGAHSYYVQKHVKQYRIANKPKDGWKFMESINMGSLYMQKKDSASSSKPIPTPRHIGKIINCFSEWPNGQRDADDDYSYLSEFAHPNMAALSHYYKWELDHARKTITVKIVPPPRKLNDLPLSQVRIAVAATLWSLSKLADTLGNRDLAEKLAHILTSLVNHN